MGRLLAADRATIVVLALGLATFAGLHTVMLFRVGGTRTVDAFRTAWLAGLGLVAVTHLFGRYRTEE